MDSTQYNNTFRMYSTIIYQIQPIFFIQMDQLFLKHFKQQNIFNINIQLNN